MNKLKWKFKKTYLGFIPTYAAQKALFWLLIAAIEVDNETDNIIKERWYRQFREFKKKHITFIK